MGKNIINVVKGKNLSFKKCVNCLNFFITIVTLYEKLSHIFYIVDRDHPVAICFTTPVSHQVPLAYNHPQSQSFAMHIAC